ncbi:reverse transcriptase [Tanacetum coccineum]
MLEQLAGESETTYLIYEQRMEGGLMMLLDYVTWSRHNLKKLFQSSAPSECAEVVSCLDRSLSDIDIERLGKPITESEAYNAVMQMHPSKAPRPDGMTPLFYQKFWNIVGPATVNVVAEFFRTGIMPPNINKTLITLILSITSPESLKDLRPISLCNVIYKIISKVIVNIIKGVPPGLIEETQSAFVTGRMITNNAIVAFEVFRWLKNKISGRKGAMAHKVDMSKAYDRVE